LLSFPKRAYLIGGTSSILDIPRALLFFRRGTQNIEEYHALIRNLLGVRKVFSYGSGRMGLYEVLKALGIGSGDEVILPGYTCIVMPAAIKLAGARPVYVDIDEGTLNLNVVGVEAAITSRTRAVLVQHTFGIPCDLNGLQKIANHHSIHLIEDAAHALGAMYQGVYCGNFGSAAVFSTEQSKMLSTDRGGLVTTNDPVLAEKLRCSYQDLSFDSEERTRMAVTRWALLNVERHPRIGEFTQTIVRRSCKWSKEMDEHTKRVRQYDLDEYNLALDGKVKQPIKLAPALALIGLIQMQRLEKDITHRNKMAKLLMDHAAAFGWQVPKIDWKMTRPSFVRFPFMVDDRNKWLDIIRSASIQGGEWLNHPVHPEGSDFEAVDYKQGMCPIAERVAKRIVNLPTHSRTGEWMLESIERALRASN
jgi:perosamine synthetase